MKAVVAGLLAVCAVACNLTFADEIEWKTPLRAFDRESPSLVLTPQGVQRQEVPFRSQVPILPSFELEQAQWSRARINALYLATTYLCAAMGSNCTPMPPAPAPLTPPGGETWRLVGCKSPNTCPGLWMPETPDGSP